MVVVFSSPKILKTAVLAVIFVIAESATEASAKIARKDKSSLFNE